MDRLVSAFGYSGRIWFDKGRLSEWYCGKNSIENDHVGDRHMNHDFWWCFGGFCGHMFKY